MSFCLADAIEDLKREALSLVYYMCIVKEGKEKEEKGEEIGNEDEDEDEDETSRPPLCQYLWRSRFTLDRQSVSQSDGRRVH